MKKINKNLVSWLTSCLVVTTEMFAHFLAVLMLLILILIKILALCQLMVAFLLIWLVDAN